MEIENGRTYQVISNLPSIHKTTQTVENRFDEVLLTSSNRKQVRIRKDYAAVKARSDRRGSPMPVFEVWSYNNSTY